MTTNKTRTGAVDRLQAALSVTEAVIGGVRPGQRDQPTPCPEFDVGALIDHLVGFATNFADKANGVTPPADPTHASGGDDPQASYHEAAVRLVAGYRSGAGGDSATPVGVAVLEAITHGWDLATATNQPAPYPNDAVDDALSAGQRMLTAQYRGEGKPFGDELHAPADACELDRLIAFMGRDPHWSA